MKCSRTVLILVLAFAPTACFLLKTDEPVDVVIAAIDLAEGKKIMGKDITITSARVSTVTPDMPRKSSQVVGHTTKVSIARGHLILLSEISD